MISSSQATTASVNKKKIDSPDKYFSSRLNEFMELHEISQTQLAKETGITRQSISKYLGGELPSAKILIEIADYFKTTPNYLLGYTNIKDCDITGDLNRFQKSTQLSENSIKTLIYWNEKFSKDNNPSLITMAFDQMISYEKGYNFRNTLFSLMACANHLKKLFVEFRSSENKKNLTYVSDGQDFVQIDDLLEYEIILNKQKTKLLIWQASRDLSVLLEKFITEEIDGSLYE